MYTLKSKKNSIIINDERQVKKGDAQIAYEGDNLIIKTDSMIKGIINYQMSWQESSGDGVPFTSLQDMKDFISNTFFADVTAVEGAPIDSTAAIEHMSEKLPARTGQHAKEASLSVVLASDQPNLKVELTNPTTEVTINNPVNEVTVLNPVESVGITGSVTIANPVNEVTVKNPVNAVSVNGSVTIANPVTTVTIANPVNAVSVSNSVTIANPVTSVSISNPVIPIASATPLASSGYPNNFRIISAANTNRTLIKAGATNVGGIDMQAPGLTLGSNWLKLYNKATAPLVSDIPVAIFPIGAGVANPPRIFINGWNFPLGLGIAITANAANTDDTAVGLSFIVVNILYV